MEYDEQGKLYFVWYMLAAIVYKDHDTVHFMPFHLSVYSFEYCNYVVLLYINIWNICLSVWDGDMG